MSSEHVQTSRIFFSNVCRLVSPSLGLPDLSHELGDLVLSCPPPCLSGFLHFPVIAVSACQFPTLPQASCVCACLFVSTMFPVVWIQVLSH